MSFGPRHTAIALFALAATAAAQYSTPVGKGAAKPTTLRATAVLEWTGALEKPSASRLVPIAIWDGEHYQPAGLYLARPAPLAFETGTQYQLERSGEPAGLFNVRGAAQLHGEWIGMGKFQAEAPPPPPPKLKVSKRLPVSSTGKPDTAPGSKEKDPAGSDRPTLHRKTDDNPAATPGTAPAGDSSSKGTSAAPAASTPSAKPSDPTSSKPDAGSKTEDTDRPTLHRRSDTSDTKPDTQSDTKPDAPASPGSSTAPATTPDSGSADPDRPTLHRHDDTTASGKAPDVDPDRPTLHRPADADDTRTGRTDDPDRPTLHRSHAVNDTTANIDPDRPHLRYGRSDDAGGDVLPTRLEGAPPAMQQMVAVSDSATGDPRPYQYHWPDAGDAAKMQSALAAIAAQAAARPNAAAASGSAKPPAQFGPSARAAARKTRAPHDTPAAAAPGLVDEHFAAYELSFSGGATLVYSAHTADEGSRRIYVTLIAQPDFSGKPQVLLQQVARADRLDETPALQLVDAVDTDDDKRAELIFQLNGATTVKDLEDSVAAQPARPAAQAAQVEVKERSFAIYRIASGKALQVFNTGPLP